MELRDKVINVIIDSMDEEGRVSATLLADWILAIPEITEALEAYKFVCDGAPADFVNRRPDSPGF